MGKLAVQSPVVAESFELNPKIIFVMYPQAPLATRWYFMR